MRNQIIQAIKSNQTTDQQFQALLDQLDTDINAKDEKGKTLLHLVLAQDFERKNFVDMLVKKKADVNIGDNNGNTPVHIAVANNKADSLEMMLNKADFSKQNNLGDTPLHSYAKMGDQAGIVFLTRFHNSLTQGMHITNKAGETPLHAAVSSDNQYFFTYFIDAYRNRYYGSGNSRDILFATANGETLAHTTIRQLAKPNLAQNEERTYTRLVKLAEVTPEMFSMRNVGTLLVAGESVLDLAKKYDASGRIRQLINNPYMVHSAAITNLNMLGAMQQTINTLTDQVTELTKMVRELRQEVQSSKQSVQSNDKDVGASSTTNTNTTGLSLFKNNQN